jgi:hypothetical protein
MCKNQINLKIHNICAMAIDTLFKKIQVEIKDLVSGCDLFLQENIHPTVSDCENIQNKLTLLQQHLAVFRYLKTEREISPSYAIHQKVSEKTSVIENVKEVITPEVIQKKVHNDSIPLTKSDEPKIEVANLKKLSIGLNDKFRFINELFNQNNHEYNIAIEQLNALHNWHETETYLNSLKNLYGWKDDKDSVKYFYVLVKQRF